MAFCSRQALHMVRGRGPSAGSFQPLEGQQALNEHLLPLDAEGDSSRKGSRRPRSGGSRRRDWSAGSGEAPASDGPRAGLDRPGCSRGSRPHRWPWTSHYSSPGPQDSGRRISETLRVQECGPEIRGEGKGPAFLWAGREGPAWGPGGGALRMLGAPKQAQDTFHLPGYLPGGLLV